MATENAVMAASLAPGETMISNAACEPHVQDLCRFLVSLGAQIDGHRLERAARSPASSGLSGGEHPIGPEHIEVGSFIGIAARDRRRHHDRGHRARRPLADPAGASSGSASRSSSATTGCASRRTRSSRSRRPRRRDPEDRGRPVAGVPGRPHVDRGRRRDAGEGHDPDLREDVREPPVLRRQARVDGRADHPLRPAPRRRHRPGAALRPAHVEPGHPRRAWRW